MKILQIISSLSAESGGPVEGLIQQGNAMVEAGHEVDTLSLDDPEFALDERLNSSAVFMLGPKSFGYGFAIRLEPWLRIHGNNYDVVIVHGLWQYHGYCVAKVARSTGLRYVVFLHGMLDPWFAKKYPTKHIKKWLYWPWGEYRVLKGAELVLFTTSEELRLARKSFWLYSVRERLVGYGVKRRDVPSDEAREAFLFSFPHLRHTRNILFLSRIHPKKGCDMLLDAFSRIAGRDSRLHLVLAGPDGVGWVDQLKLQAANLGVTERVTFTGMLKGATKWGAYDTAEVFALPSHQENFGVVIAEALASGLPVLTTFQVNIWREIADAGAGFVRADTQEGTDQLLEDWLNLAGEEQTTMRNAAIACFESTFELSNITQKLLGALTDAASETKSEYTFRGKPF